MRPSTEDEQNDHEIIDDSFITSNFILYPGSGKIEKISVSDLIDTVETFYSVDLADYITEIRRRELGKPDFRSFSEIRFPITCVENRNWTILN